MKFDRKKWKKINDVLRKHNIDPNQVKFINNVRHSGKKESKKHFMAKAEKCYDLYQMGHPYLCEPWSLDRKRKIDVLDLEDGIAYEFESDHSIEKKGTKTVKI